jgi:hypothetical protein
MLSMYMANEIQDDYEIISPEKSLSSILEKIKTEIEETTKHLTMKEKIMKEMYENSICFVNEKMSLFKWYKSKKTGCKYFATITYFNNQEITVVFNRLNVRKSDIGFSPIVRAYFSGKNFTESLSMVDEIFLKTELIITKRTESVLVEISSDKNEIYHEELINHKLVNVCYSYKNDALIKSDQDESYNIKYRILSDYDQVASYVYAGRYYSVPIVSKALFEHFLGFKNKAILF